MNKNREFQQADQFIKRDFLFEIDANRDRGAKKDRRLEFWVAAQLLVWAAGMFIWGALLLKPKLGLHLLWNVLIPIAPALFVFAPGIWRNVCPLGSMALAPHHAGLSLKKKLSPTWRARFFLVSFTLLLAVVPLRKVVLDTNGPILAAILGVVGVLAIVMGVVFKWKSGWCSSLCPVYPVELLYGSRSLLTVPNAHCASCQGCVAPCSESVAGLTPLTAVNTKLGRWIGLVFVGCFPGFVWGWYQVTTYSGWEGFANLNLAYGIPYASGLITLVLFLILRGIIPTQTKLLTSIFAASAIIIYYWFRLPPMFGIGDPNAAMMLDISPYLPEWSATAMRISMIIVFTWMIVGRRNVRSAWETKPAIIEKSAQKSHPIEMPSTIES